MSNFDDTDERGFFQRFGFVLGIVGLIALGAVMFAGRSLFSGHGGSVQHKQQEISIRLPPLPPMPTPPPPPEPPKLVEQKMIEQQQVDDKEEKPDDKPPEPAPAALTTNNVGNGGPDFGLRAGKGSGGFLQGSRGGGQHGRWGWYASQVQKQIADALRKNPRTRTATLRIEARVWPDITGRITRATLAGSTGDPALDATLKNDVLTGMQLQEAPPQGMPAPIVMRLTARRTN